jgi:hypothetical protein
MRIRTRSFRVDPCAVAAAGAICLALSMAACGGNSDSPRALSRRLASLDATSAEAEFKRLSARRQVDVVLWDLNHSRPAGSPYSGLVLENRQAVVLLYHEAAATDSHLMSFLLLEMLIAVPEARGDFRNEFGEAIAHCFALAGNKEDSLCSDARDQAPPFLVQRTSGS